MPYGLKHGQITCSLKRKYNPWFSFIWRLVRFHLHYCNIQRTYFIAIHQYTVKATMFVNFNRSTLQSVLAVTPLPMKTLSKMLVVYLLLPTWLMSTSWQAGRTVRKNIHTACMVFSARVSHLPLQESIEPVAVGRTMVEAFTLEYWGSVAAPFNVFPILTSLECKARWGQPCWVTGLPWEAELDGFKG